MHVFIYSYPIVLNGANVWFAMVANSIDIFVDELSLVEWIYIVVHDVIEIVVLFIMAVLNAIIKLRRMRVRRLNKLITFQPY